ncbi:hypothetical protein CROQUDRAFT_142307 [Cronartium quercuum f. sp. fusiforme G11]|uniref:Uncharacterized protein n=1 Tax=Cronartium quercuum f. sp. fusiforme G11 TaxID=708437 RepID=A0A9P6NYC2_9BASI|nr:hypothetical protein CROQUDRAFT_142307 [Cronartium quercuum f. sp. fusiforme G11]
MRSELPRGKLEHNFPRNGDIRGTFFDHQNYFPIFTKFNLFQITYFDFVFLFLFLFFFFFPTASNCILYNRLLISQSNLLPKHFFNKQHFTASPRITHYLSTLSSLLTTFFFFFSFFFFFFLNFDFYSQTVSIQVSCHQHVLL